MVIIPFNLCKNIKRKLDVYEADGYYIKECYDNNSYDNNNDKHVYIDQDLCYYNFFYNKFVFKDFFLINMHIFFIHICLFLFIDLYFFYFDFFISLIIL